MYMYDAFCRFTNPTKRLWHVHVRGVLSGYSPVTPPPQLHGRDIASELQAYSRQTIQYPRTYMCIAMLLMQPEQVGPQKLFNELLEGMFSSQTQSSGFRVTESRQAG